MTLAFAGDVHAEGPSGDAVLAGLPSIRDALGRADLTVVNLETAVTDRGTPADKQFVFRAPPAVLPALEDAGLDVVSLANNHGSTSAARDSPTPWPRRARPACRSSGSVRTRTPRTPPTSSR